ncbi:hypothetical protein AB0D08_28845 [Kitasatospora sp. NPDC048540]|uniref:hypothetical protein n=1 Tax=unclassified Kitasatospora TaxID=2633591 RepID=UPI00068FE079|nr:hypothetical protein [Kitasatospora sp. MBT63]
MLTGQGRRSRRSAEGPATAGRSGQDGQTPAGTAGDQAEAGTAGPRTVWSLLPLLAAGLGLTAVAVNGALQAFLGVAAGVIALVSFSSAVLWGLAATDRLLLHPVHRLAAQAIHRAMGIAGVVFLVLHVWMNLIQDQIGAVSAFIPFADPHRPVVLGLGVLAGYVLLAVALAGAARGALARTGEAGRWRIVHICAYPAWGAGLIHGLNAGRLPAGWVSILYSLAVAGVVVALALRLAFQDRGSLRRAAVPVRPEPETRPTVGVGSERRRQDG